MLLNLFGIETVFNKIWQPLFKTSAGLKLNFLTGLLLLILSENSFANILYLDLNMSSPEVYRLKKDFGDKVTVLPEVPDKDRQTVMLMNIQIEKLEKQRTACWKKSSDCSGIQAILKEKYAERLIIYDRNRLDLKTLYNLIKTDSLKEENQFNTLILSGHSGTGDFYGELVSLPIPEIRKLTAKFPHLRKSISSIYLWGCYTMTSFKINNLWLSIFPNLKVMTGFVLVAPRADREANLNALSGLLKIKDEIQKTARTQDLAKILYRLKDLSYLNFAVYSVDCDCFVARNSQGSLNEISEKICTKMENEFQIWADVFNCYYSTEGGPHCKEVPANPGDSDLRKAYNYFQQTEHCFADATADADVPDTARMIRLIKYKDVLKNFKVFYKNDILEINSILRELRAPDTLMVPDLGDYSLTRRKVLDYLRALNDFIDQLPQYEKNEKSESDYLSIIESLNFRLPKIGILDTLEFSSLSEFIGQLKGPGNSEKIFRLKAIYKNFESMLNEVSPCVPFGWIEPDSHARPAC
jgi:hypothetical protein